MKRVDVKAPFSGFPHGATGHAPGLLALVFLGWLATVLILPLAAEDLPHLNLSVAAMQYSRELGHLYVVTTSGSSENPSALVAVNPATRTVEWSMPLTSPGAALAVSAESKYIYVWDRATRAVLRISTATHSVDLRIPVQSTGSATDPMNVLLAGHPKRPEVIALSVSPARGRGFDGGGLWLVDGQTIGAAFRSELSAAVPLWAPGRLAFDADGKHLYGMPGETGAPGIYDFALRDGAFALVAYRTGLVSQDTPGLVLAAGRLYDNKGNAAETSTLLPDGWLFNRLRDSGLPALRDEDGLLYVSERDFFDGAYVRAYDPETYLPKKQLRLTHFAQQLAYPLSASCGDVLAFGGDRNLLLVAAGDVASIPDRPLPAASESDAMLTIPVEANDVVYCPQTGRVYATLAQRAGSLGNSVAEIDPASGRVLRTVFVGSWPQQLAVSRDGRYLYVGVMGRASVVRLSLPGLDARAEFRLVETNRHVSSDLSISYPGWIEVAPDDPERVAISATQNERVDREPELLSGGLRVLDHGRYVPYQGPEGITSFAFGRDRDQLYAYDDGGTTALMEFSLTGGNPILLRRTEGFSSTTGLPGFPSPIAFQQGRLYTHNGRVVDTARWALEGSFATQGLPLPDSGRNRVNYLRPFGFHFVYEFDPRSFRLTGIRPIPPADQTSRDFIAVGDDGFAYRTVSPPGIHFFSRTSLTPVPLQPPPEPQPVGPLTRLSWSFQDIAEDPRNGDLLGVIASDSVSTPNQLVRVDAATGRLIRGDFAGSDPIALSVAADGRTVHLALAGVAGIGTLDLESGSRTPPVVLGGADQTPLSVTASPGDPDKAFVTTWDWLYLVRPSSGVATRLRRYHDFVSPHFVAAGRQVLGIRGYATTGPTPLLIDLEPTEGVPDTQFSTLKPSEVLFYDLLFRLDGARLVNSYGIVLDATTFEIITQLHPNRLSREHYAVDANRQRIYGAEFRSDLGAASLRIHAYDAETYREKEFREFPLGSVQRIRKFVALRNGRFAVLMATPEDSGVVFLGHLESLQPVTNDGPRPVVENRGGQVRAIPLPVDALAYDPAQKRIYLAIPDSAPWGAGSVVPLNPETGALGDPLGPFTAATWMDFDTDAGALVVGERRGTVLTWFSPASRQRLRSLPLGFGQGTFEGALPPGTRKGHRRIFGKGLVAATPGNHLLAAREFFDPVVWHGLLVSSGATVAEPQNPRPTIGLAAIARDPQNGALYAAGFGRFVRLAWRDGRLETEATTHADPFFHWPGDHAAFAIAGNNAYVDHHVYSLDTGQLRWSLPLGDLLESWAFHDPEAGRTVVVGRVWAARGLDLVALTFDMATGAPLNRRVITSFSGGSESEFVDIRDAAHCGVDCFSVAVRFYTQSPHRTVRHELFLLDELYSQRVPVVQPEGIVHAASFEGGMTIAPGQIVSIFGANLGPAGGAGLRLEGNRVSTELGGTQVLLNGEPIPLLYAGGSQVNAIVPYQRPGDIAQFEVLTPAGRSAPVRRVYTSSVPGIFSRNASGRGQGAILNQDYSINSSANPARRGEAVMVFATGGGFADRPIEAGELAGTALWRLAGAPAAELGGVPAAVEYAGAAPGLVNGVNQFNVRIPPTAPLGDRVELRVFSSNSQSQDGLTIAIRD